MMKTCCLRECEIACAVHYYYYTCVRAVKSMLHAAVATAAVVVVGTRWQSVNNENG